MPFIYLGRTVNRGSHYSAHFTFSYRFASLDNYSNDVKRDTVVVKRDTEVVKSYTVIDPFFMLHSFIIRRHPDVYVLLETSYK